MRKYFTITSATDLEYTLSNLVDRAIVQEGPLFNMLEIRVPFWKKETVEATVRPLLMVGVRLTVKPLTFKEHFTVNRIQTIKRSV